MISNPAEFTTDAILRDGGSIHIRALRPDDKDGLVHLFSRLSQRSVYFRFFRSKKELTPGELVQFTELDFVREAALVAALREEGQERIIGVGRYSALPASSGPFRRADVSFVVADDHQGRGIGTLLLEHLVRIAQINGITEFEADVLGENNQMLKVFGDSGFEINQSLEGGVFRVSFRTRHTDDFAEASYRRERKAAAQSIRSLLEPRSVAVVGATPEPTNIGRGVVANLQRCGFKGPIYPVNSTRAEVEGLAAFGRVTEIGSPIDLVVIAVPAPRVEEVVEDCARAGAKGVVVITSGFGETASEGKQLEKRLRRIVRSSGMRMVGPNCMGILNTDPSVSLNATFVPSWPPPGNIAVSSQSGALGYVVLDQFEGLGIGVSSFVSVGNKADISGNDLLAYWGEDKRTRVITLYLENFGNPRKFARVTPEVARNKPIVAVKSGRTAAGARAAFSHSASLASLDIAVDALFAQAGVIRTETLEELLDVALLLSTQPAPIGPGVGIITNAGGPGILVADACEARGLKLPALAPETISRLRSFLPEQSSLQNPVDMIASATAQDYARTIETVGNDNNTDALIVIYVPPMLCPSEVEEAAEAISKAASCVPAQKPVLLVFPLRGAPSMTGPRGRIPSYKYPENAARALSAARSYGQWRARPRGSFFQFTSFSRSAIRAVVDRLLYGKTEPFSVEPRDLATILRIAEIDYALTETVDMEDTEATAERMGYPLVMKIQGPDIAHKSDLGGVIMGVHSRKSAQTALATLRNRMGHLGVKLTQVQLQREIPGGIEALVGVTTDPMFGPLVVCGLGGILVELAKDVSFRLTPVSDLDAEDMVSRLRSRELLDGYRGAPPGDRVALVRLIQKISALIDLIPELRELDLNPVKVLEPGRGAIAVDGRMWLGPTPIYE